MYTRRGDSGETDAGSKRRVGKDSPIVEVEGEVDELLSFIGQALVNSSWDDIIDDLQRIQEDIFAAGEDISAEGRGRTIGEERIKWLEQRIMEYKKEIGPIKLFVIPGGSKEAAVLHVARTIARRLERSIVTISKEFKISKNVLIYMNRLSSLLFMHALVSNKRLNIKERIWSLQKE